MNTLWVPALGPVRAGYRGECWLNTICDDEQGPQWYSAIAIGYANTRVRTLDLDEHVAMTPGPKVMLDCGLANVRDFLVRQAIAGLHSPLEHLMDRPGSSIDAPRAARLIADAYRRWRKSAPIPPVFYGINESRSEAWMRISGGGLGHPVHMSKASLADVRKSSYVIESDGTVTLPPWNVK